MKIPNSLPQFNEKPTLVLVTGKQDASFWFATDGNFEEIDHFRIQPPKKYTKDQKGFFKMRGGGGVVTTGPLKEKDGRQDIQDFLSTLLDHLKKAVEEYKCQDIILLRPRYMKNATEHKIPDREAKKLIMTIRGNFVDEHPKVILERIDKEMSKVKNSRKVKPVSTAVSKILNRGKK